MRFLFTTLQTYESTFYGRVGAELVRLGHEASHVTVSRASARALRRGGADAVCLLDLIAELPEADGAEEVARIEATYEIPHIRDVYRGDWPCAGRSEEWCVRRTVQHFRALERRFDEIAPDLVVPEVGNETIRVASHLIGLARGIPVFFLLYTIFPNPLRLYVDTLHAPIVPESELRELSPEERAELETFRKDFLARARPIRDHRRVPIELRRVAVFADHVRRRRGEDRDNDYLRPGRLLGLNVSEWLRAKAAAPFYCSVSGQNARDECGSRTENPGRLRFADHFGRDYG